MAIVDVIWGQQGTRPTDADGVDHGYLTVAGLNRAAKIIANNDDDIGWIIEIVVHF